MRMHPVTFVLDFAIVGPVALQLWGIPTPVKMGYSGTGWKVTLELPPGIYKYRFCVADSLFLNDPRRTTQQPDGDEIWSILKVDREEGPMWVERSWPTIKDILVCRGVSDAFMPLMVIDRARLEDMPITLWLGIENLFSNAFLQVFLLCPDGGLAFGGEYVLDPEWADGEYNAKFHLATAIESDGFVAGQWSFVVRSEGGHTIAKTLEIER